MYARQSQMIRCNLSKCFSTLTLAHTRCYSTKSKDDFKILQVPDCIKRKKDYLPGIERRKKFLQDWDESEALGHNENEVISPNIDPEEFHAMQADFMQLDESYDSHEKEILLKRRLKERYQMRKKHFKEAKQPKLLTVTDMHQIKVLHEQDPNTWTVEKLSTSFPATPSIIMKVLKSNTPRTAERMKDHDTEVKRNWVLLQTGQLTGLSPDYEYHLSMFSFRDPVVRTMEEYQQFQPPIHKYVPESTEFRSIITSYYDMLKMKKNLKSSVETLHNTRSIVGTDGSQTKQLMSSERGIETKDGRRENVKQIQRNKSNKNNLTLGMSGTHDANFTQRGSLARRFSTFRSYLAARITDDSTTNKTETKETDPDQVEKSRVDQLDTSDTSNMSANEVGSADKTDGNAVERMDASHVVETETSSNKEASFDRNQTVFSDRPEHWREIERLRLQEEMEKEWNKQEAMEDRAMHDGQWRKMARNQKQQYTDDLDIDAFNSGRNQPRETREFHSRDSDDLDIDAFNSGRNPPRETRELHSRNQHSVEAGGDAFNSRRNSPGQTDSGFLSRDDEDLDIDGFNSRGNSAGNRDARLNTRVSESAEDSRDASASSSINSSGAPDRNKRMYPTKPPHWIEIVRRREMDEREKRIIATKLTEERSERSMYDGQWRRLRPRREGQSDRRASLENQIDARIAALRERRMDTLTNSEEEMSEQEDFARRSQITRRENTVRRSAARNDERDYVMGDTDEGKHVSTSWSDEQRSTLIDINDPGLMGTYVVKPGRKGGINDDRQMTSLDESKQNAAGFDYQTFARESAARLSNETDGSADGESDGVVNPYGEHNSVHTDSTELDNIENSLQESSNIDRSSLTPTNARKRSQDRSPEPPRPVFDAYLEEGIPTRSRMEHFTLDRLKGTLQSKAARSEPLDREEEVLLTSYNTHEQLTNPLYTGHVNHTGIVSQGVDINERDVQVELALHVEDYIEIPKEQYKAGAVYKVDDCFYNDRGEFLYRVPGLKNA